MRLILAALFLLIFFIISIPLYLIEWIIGRFNHRAMVASSQKIVVGAFHVIHFISGVKKTVIGRNNVPKGEVILISQSRTPLFLR